MNYLDDRIPLVTCKLGEQKAENENGKAVAISVCKDRVSQQWPEVGETFNQNPVESDRGDGQQAGQSKHSKSAESLRALTRYTKYIYYLTSDI